ncbi:hypothetical protein I7I48_02423 [Histoplasma ohiense]|nr:hypothetical protein I7I48_02423 [Histoplasma ohiense (nom. inval.)]
MTSFEASVFRFSARKTFSVIQTLKAFSPFSRVLLGRCSLNAMFLKHQPSNLIPPELVANVSIMLTVCFRYQGLLCFRISWQRSEPCNPFPNTS